MFVDFNEMWSRVPKYIRSSVRRKVDLNSVHIIVKWDVLKAILIKHHNYR